MDKLAIHMRISGVAVSDVDVDSRRAAATSLAAKWKKDSVPTSIVSRVADIADALGRDGHPSPGLGAEVQNAIQKKSSSFLYEERPLDVGVCAGMAIVSILSSTPGNHGWTITDVYATALWSALGYQPVLEAARREDLRREVLEVAKNWVSKSAKKARQRIDVPDVPSVEITVGPSNAVTSNFNDSVAGTVEALRRNAALDREELDFLWWTQLGRSRLLNKQLSTIPEPMRIVACGLESATMLRRLPCEVHREMVLRTLDADPELDLAQLLVVIGADRAALYVPFNGGSVTLHPTVFPLLNSLSTGEVSGLGAAVKRRVSEWGERALLEAGLAKMMSQGLAKL